MSEYLVKQADRDESILNNTSDKIKFQHQKTEEIEEFRNGIFENRLDVNPFGTPVYLGLQDNFGAGEFVRKNDGLISAAAREFRIEPDLVRAVIYTEMSRGWYDKLNFLGSESVLPGNIIEKWEDLISGTDIHNKGDNIRITAKLLSEIGKRLDEPYPEDIYSLYNSTAHDRTYQNDKLKTTPYFMRQVMELKAWQYEKWSLPNKIGIDAIPHTPSHQYGVYQAPSQLRSSQIGDMHGFNNIFGNGDFRGPNSGPFYGQRQLEGTDKRIDGLHGKTAFDRIDRAHTLVTTGSRDTEMEAALGLDSGLLPDGVRKGLERLNRRIEIIDGTNREQLPEVSPLPRPRPKLNPITEGYLKDMPDDGRLILAAEIVGFNGRKVADKAEASRLARFDVQRKMALDLEDVKAGKVSTVWTEYGHPKAVRDLLGEEAYQNFVDDRLEAGIISNATAGLHLLQDAELFGIADSTTKLEAPHEKLTELMTPKVLAAAAERARDILDMRRTKPSEAVLLSADLSNRKAQFDTAFDANEAVDAEEMDAFLFYHEAAQREIGIAEPAIEMIPPRWASQVAARFEATPVDNGTPTGPRAREAELKQHYTELQQSFGSRTDDVIAYSLARTASNGAFHPVDGAPAEPRAQ